MTARVVEQEALSSLAPFATLPDWLAAGMDGERVADELVRHVPALSSGDVRLLSCTPERLRAKGEEWLARYRLEVAAADGEPREIVLVGNLRAPTQPGPAVDGATAGVAFGEIGWTVWLPDLRLQLRVQPSDEALPALPTLVDPAAAASLLQPVLRAAGYRDATIAACSPEVVRYKPGSRCTVVVRLEYADNGTAPRPQSRPRPPSPVVLKTHQGDKGQTAWAAMTALWERPQGWREVLTLAEPLAYLAQERILVQGPVPEESTLKELARRAVGDGSPAALEQLRVELVKTGRALAALHQCGASYGRTATIEGEIAEVREVIARLSRTVPPLQAAAEPLLQHLTRCAAQEQADPMVPAHHDFRPAQVLLHQGRVGFIDFDGAAMAEPALDLGRFRAKLRDIGISALAFGGAPLTGQPLAQNLRLLDELCEVFLTAYERHAPVSRPRVLLWETCDLLTAMLHAWTKVRLLRIEPRLLVLLHHLRTSGLAGSGSRPATGVRRGVVRER